MADELTEPAASELVAAAAPAADLLARTKADIVALIADYQAQFPAGKKVTVKDMWGLAFSGWADIVKLGVDAEAIADLDPKELRSVLADAALRFFKEVIEPLEIPGVPSFITHTIVDPLIEREIPTIVAAVLDSFSAVLRKAAAPAV